MSERPLFLEALEMLGQLLEAEGRHYDLVVVGGGALVLQGYIQRPTEDLDVLAMVGDDGWRGEKPFPEPLARLIGIVGLSLDLPVEGPHDRAWLNPGPSFLMDQGLPIGFQQRVETRRFHGLTLRVAARIDLLYLKVLAATSFDRIARRKVDVADLVALRPTPTEIRGALRWCAGLDGRPDFLQTEGADLCRSLGLPEEVS